MKASSVNISLGVSLDSLMDTAVDGVFIIGEKGGIKAWNPKMETIFGWTQIDAVGKPVYSLLIPERSQAVLKKDIENYFTTKESVVVGKRSEFTVLHKEGYEFSVEIVVNPVPTNDNFNLVCFVRDISHEKNMIDKLHEAEGLSKDLRHALDKSAIVATTNAKGEITFVNDTFCEISGYTRDELLGKDHRIINSGYHTKEFMSKLWKTISSGKVWKGEVKNKAKNGSFYWVNTTIVPFIGPNGKPYQYKAIRFDITNEKRAVESTSYFGGILEENLTWIYIIRQSDLKFVSVNKSAIANIGYSLEELIEMTPMDINNVFTSVEQFRGAVAPLSNGNKKYLEINTVHRRKDGDLYNAQINLQLSVFKEEPVFVAFVTDVTGKMEAEKQREKFELELTKTVEDLKKSNDALDSFVYRVSHDLKSPAINMGSMLSMLKQTNGVSDDPFVGQIMENIDTSVDRMQNIIEDLLELSKVERKRKEVKTVVSLHDSCGVVQKTFENQLKDLDVDIEVDFSLCEEVFFSETELNSVFQNFLTNSIKYRSKDKKLKISVRSEKEEDFDVIYYSDNGIGMDLEKLGHKLFGMFERLHTDIGIEGTGVGLHIVKKLIENAGGTIDVESKVGLGTTFIVYLPQKVKE